METLRFKPLPHLRCRASGPSFLLLTSYFLIFPLRSNRFSLREFAAETIKCPAQPSRLGQRKAFRL